MSFLKIDILKIQVSTPINNQNTALPYLAKSLAGWHIICRTSLDRALCRELMRDCSPLNTAGNCVISRGKVETANPKKGGRLIKQML
jgi:hypothetical protein